MDILARAPADAPPPGRRPRAASLRLRAPRAPGARPPWTAAWDDVLGPRPTGGRLRAARRIAGVLAWTLVSIPLQALLLVLPGEGARRFGRLYHAVLCRLIGLRVQVAGAPCGAGLGGGAGGPVLYLSNHSSWLDVPVLGGVLEAAFVSKAEVGTWPLVRTVARLGRTVYVSRARGATGREAEGIRARLESGGDLVLFPEGTSSDGGRVLPFRSAFLATADAARRIQPVSVVYDRLGGLPACRRDRPVFAWYGDMDLGTHFWRLARRSGARATVLLHAPIDPAAFAGPDGRVDRKALALAVEAVVSAGAAALRQNRPPVPLTVVPPPRLARAPGAPRGA